MDKEQRIKLTTEYPRVKCVRCTYLLLLPKPVKCTLNLDPLTCGRNFSPPGGQIYTPDEPDIKPKNKDGIELKEETHATQGIYLP